jgi:phosphatidylglycerophosphate synthase
MLTLLWCLVAVFHASSIDFGSWNAWNVALIGCAACDAVMDGQMARRRVMTAALRWRR